jgi:hypothetical protein
MSNERRNPYYKKKNHKNTSSVTIGAVTTRAGAARMNETNDMMAAARDADRTSTNEMNVSIEYDANAGLNDLNDLGQPTTQGIQATTPVINRNPAYITNLEATMDNTQRTTNTMNTPSPSSTATGRVMLVHNESPANPNDVESFAIRLRQYSTGTRLRSAPTIPKVSQEYIHIGYYDIKVRVEQSDNPWEELIESTKDIFIQLWKADPTIKVFVYERGERNSDSSY